MPVVKNRYFNDPNIGQGFANLSQMFAPASAADVAQQARAAEIKQKIDMKAALWNNASNDPDRLGTIADLYDPTQSYYAQDQNTTTARRAQDIDAATKRASSDALIAEQAKEATDKNRLGLVTSAFQPLNVGQVRPAIPASIASQYELPALPTEVGAMNVGQGDTTFLPGGQVLRGADKPLTDAELKAHILNELPKSEQRIAALGNVDTTNVATAAGPRVAFTADAVGQEPFIQRGAEAKPTNGQAVLKSGERIPAVQDSDGKWHHAQTGALIPAEQISAITSMPSPQGADEAIGIGPTVANNTASNNQEAEITRGLALTDMYEQALRGNPGALGVAGLIRGTAQNAVATAQDLARSFGGSAPEIQQAAAEVQSGLQGIAPEMFDKSIPEIQFLQGTLAYSLARTENPSGEVSRQAYDRALSRVQGGGLLANSQSALAAVDALRGVYNTQLEGVKNLRNPGTGRTDTTYRGPPGVPTLGPNDKAAYDALPSGAPFIAPDGKQRVKP